MSTTAPPRELGPARFPAPAAAVITLPGPPAVRRDEVLDLLRGLSLVVLVINHTRLDSALAWLTAPFLSAAETLVIVSGVVVGMVFGRRWRSHGARATTAALLRRALELYRASVCVVVLVAVLALVPGLATEALTVRPWDGASLYPSGNVAGQLPALLTLAAIPWQFAILGFFIAAIALAPGLLWLLARGWWPALLLGSWSVFLAARLFPVDVLPFRSEEAFPVLVWQLLFVHGAALGWHRARVERLLRRSTRTAIGAIVVLTLVAAYVRLHELGFSPFGVSPAEWRSWDRAHFDKASLDPARLVSMLAFTAAAYLLLARLPSVLRRGTRGLLLPLGQASFYVFIVHVFLCLALASVPPLAGDGIGLVGNTLVQVGVVALLWAMVRGRVLFGVIPR